MVRSNLTLVFTINHITIQNLIQPKIEVSPYRARRRLFENKYYKLCYIVDILS